LGCGSNGTTNRLGEVGTYGEGGVFTGGDAGASSPLDATIEQNGVHVEVVTLSCAGSCAMVEAVATGGNPPYTFAWDDGATTPTRQVCPTSDRAYGLSVTDTAVAGELAHAAATARASVTADVLACPDAGPPADAAPEASAPACPPPGPPLTSGCETVTITGQFTVCPDVNLAFSYACLAQPLAAGHSYKTSIISNGVIDVGDPEVWTAWAGNGCATSKQLSSVTVSASGNIDSSACAALTANAPALVWDDQLTGSFHAVTAPNDITVQICEGCP
jgi:hypothetical protein